MNAELKTLILECKDLASLSGFYTRLLGWPVVFQTEGFIRIQPPGGTVGLGFQQDEDYIRPVWPTELHRQQIMAHMDFAVANRNELEEAVKKAEILGAKKAGAQYGDEWVTMLDPAGHPFCFVIWE